MQAIHKVLGGLVFALVTAQASQAAIVYNNGAPDRVSGTNMSGNQVAEDFIIGATTDITNIRFWTIQSTAGDYSGNLFWAIYSNSLGQPNAVVQGGAAVAVTETATGLSTLFNYAEFVIDIPVAFQLAAGTYWLGLANSPLDPADPSEMLWETTASFGSLDGLYLDGADWFGTGNDHAFLIEGRNVIVPPPGIPEPGTLALLVGALFAARVTRCRA